MINITCTLISFVKAIIQNVQERFEFTTLAYYVIKPFVCRFVSLRRSQLSKREVKKLRLSQHKLATNSFYEQMRI